MLDFFTTAPVNLENLIIFYQNNRYRNEIHISMTYSVCRMWQVLYGDGQKRAKIASGSGSEDGHLCWGGNRVSSLAHLNSIKKIRTLVCFACRSGALIWGTWFFWPFWPKCVVSSSNIYIRSTEKKRTVKVLFALFIFSEILHVLVHDFLCI